MHKQLHSGLLALAALLTASGLSAQSVTFAIEKDVLNVPANLDLTFVYGGTFADSYDLSGAVASIIQAAATNPNEAATLLEGLVGNFAQWGAIPKATASPLSNLYDWYSVPPTDASTSPVGSSIYLLILSSDIGSITTSTRVGILTNGSAHTLPGPDPAPVIGFNTGTYNWNNAVMGAFAEGGTFDLQAIPEPSTTALLCSALVACLAIARRRRRK